MGKTEMKTIRTLSLCALAAVSALGAFADYASDRQAAVRRRRDVMYYALGFEPCFWPRNLPFSQQNFWNVRLNALLKTPTPIDTLVYCPIGGFGCLSAKIPSAEMPLKQPSEESTWMRGYRNALPDFVKAGTDPVKEVVAWAQKNKKELFIALPVNSREHANTQKNRPILWDNYFWSPWKERHPNDLVGAAADGAQRYGSATDVNYAMASVRAEYVSMAKDIAETYAVDGIMMDFCSSPLLFASVACGGKAGAKEWQQITEMVAQIRKAVDAAGQKRGRPVLLTARVPDSLSFCKDMGLDLMAVVGQGLLDFVVAGGTVELNPWSYMGDALKKSGVPFYASFNISDIFVGNDSGYEADDDRPTLRRQSPQGYRARIQEAGVGGAAGVMFVNPYHWHRFGLHCVCGTIQSVKTQDKRYFVTYRQNSTARNSMSDGMKHCTREQLVSMWPYDLKGAPAKYGVYVWDDVAALKRQGNAPSRAILTTETSIPSGCQISVTFNGKAVKPLRKIAGSQQFEVPLSALKYGRNEVVVKATGKNKRGQTARLGNVAVDVVFANGREGGAK